MEKTLKIFSISLVSTTIFLNALAQKIEPILFQQLPQDYQLYPRDGNDTASVPISGTIELANYQFITVQIIRNDKLVKTIRTPVVYNNGRGKFSCEGQIKAELANYTFKIYAVTDSDSSLIITRQKIVGGDTYIIMGQSNSTGFFQEKETYEYCRTFGIITPTYNIEPYQAEDTLWSIANQTGYSTNVGTMGLQIGKSLSEQSGFPICVINGGAHWSSAFSNAFRNSDNPYDFTTIYGRMLYRVQKAGFKNNVTGFIFRQGETEAYNDGFDWEENFDKLYKNLKLDLPSIEQIYVYQIDIIYYPTPVGAEVRDYQRRLSGIYPDIKTLATVGTSGFDGLHYTNQGYIQNGNELARIISKDFYGLPSNQNIYSPLLKKVFYKSKDYKELVLVFDKGQSIVYPSNYMPKPEVILNLKDYLYLDGQAGDITTGIAQDNKVTLTSKRANRSAKISYLPMYLEQGGSYYPFTGPNITNSLGMRALTFYNVPIYDALDIPSLSATWVSSFTPEVALKWNSILDATGYVLERKLDSETNYTTIATLSNASLTYTDNNVNQSGEIEYRIHAVSGYSESADYGRTTVNIQLITGLNETNKAGINIFPNPTTASHGFLLNFESPISGAYQLFNELGKEIQNYSITEQKSQFFETQNMTLGLYFIKFSGANGVVRKKLVITP